MERINKKVVFEKIEENKQKIKDFGVKKIGVFGSIIQGRLKRRSDIDIIIEFNELSFDNYAEVLILLEKILKRKIDLVTESSLRPELNYVKDEAEYAKL